MLQSSTTSNIIRLFFFLLTLSVTATSTPPVILVESSDVVICSQSVDADAADVAIIISAATIQLIKSFSEEPANLKHRKALRSDNAVKQILYLLRSKSNLTARLMLQSEQRSTTWLKIDHESKKPKIKIDINFKEPTDLINLFIKQFADVLLHLTTIPQAAPKKEAPTTKEKISAQLKENKFAVIAAGVVAVAAITAARRYLPERPKLRHKGNGFTVYSKKCPKQEGPFCSYHATANALLVFQALKDRDTITLQDIIKVDLSHTSPESIALIRHLFFVEENKQNIPHYIAVANSLKFDIDNGKNILFLSPHDRNGYDGLSDLEDKKYPNPGRKTLIQTIKQGKVVVTPWWVGPRKETNWLGKKLVGHAVCRVFIPKMKNGKVTHLDVVHIDSGGGFFDTNGKEYEIDFDPYTFDEDLQQLAEACFA